MKAVNQRHPRLYISIINNLNRHNGCKLKYYDNQYDNNGDLQLKTNLIKDELSIKHSPQSYLYDLNKIEYRLLLNLIKKQKRVIELYVEKKKLVQAKTIRASLDLLFEYEAMFNEWFINNKLKV